MQKSCFSLCLGKAFFYLGLFLFIVSSSVFADGGPAPRRYLNEVFSEHTRMADIVYGKNYNDKSGKTEKLTVRIFEPKGDTAKKRPLVIITPGGGFLTHDDKWMDDFGILLARAGYVVAINRYRLSEEGVWSSKKSFGNALFKAFSDQKALIRYFVKDAQGPNKYKVDTKNIFIGGHSAGGFTSLYVAYLDEKDALAKEFEAAMNENGGLQGNSGHAGFNDYKIRGVINMSGGLLSLGIMQAGEPALMSLHGSGDDVVSLGTMDMGDIGQNYGARPIHVQAEKVGLKHELHIIEGAGHNDTANTTLCPECAPLVRRFMFKHLNTSGLK
jgi:dienelactone hydrolase